MDTANPDIFKSDILTGHVAVVTGGSCGIGRAVCLTLAKAGADVVVGYHRDARAAQETCDAAVRSGVRATAIQADMGDPATATDLIEQARDTLGTVDILINSAGVWPTANVWEMTDEQWRRTQAVNLDGTFYACRAASREMMPKRAGKIINFSSIAATRGARTGHADYAASKGGVDALTKSLARELGPYSIHVNAVAPGMIRTRMTEDTLQGKEKGYLDQTPLGRVGTPEDVAGLVVFLASTAADYITGQIFHVNGGMLMP